jgi:glycosyltransferase involved in cell wall biosynthesis
LNNFISIIIPVFNRASLIKDTLESVIEQSSAQWECIVVDDGSTDGTVSVVDAFAKADNRISVYKRTEAYPSGGNGARQMGLDKARSTYVMFLDSDDLLARHAVASRVKHVTKENDMSIFPTGTFLKEQGDQNIVWNILNEKSDAQSCLERFLNQDMPWHTTGVLWKTAFLKSIGGWNLDLKAWQDWELHVRALTKNPTIKSFKMAPDHYYRRDVENSIASQKKTKQYIISVHEAIRVVEPLVLNKYDSSLIRRKFQFLIYRNFIAIPLKWNYIKLSKEVFECSQNYESVTRFQFYRFLMIERFMSITLIKIFLKNKMALDYYQLLYPKTTFLKIRR